MVRLQAHNSHGPFAWFMIFFLVLDFLHGSTLNQLLRSVQINVGLPSNKHENIFSVLLNNVSHFVSLDLMVTILVLLYALTQAVQIGSTSFLILIA